MSLATTRLAACAALLALIGAPAAARDLDSVDFTTESGQVTAALAAAAFAATPSPYNALLFLERTRQNDIKFRNAHLGAGIAPFAGSGFYVEGFVAAQDYAPQFSVQDSAGRLDRTVRWRSAAVTGGVGWSFEVAPETALRPTLIGSIGRMTSNSDIPDPDDPDGRVDFIADDGLTFAGYGASLALDHIRRREAYELDLRARVTGLRMVPLGDKSDVDADIDASTAAFVARLRLPIERWQMFGGPVRSVYEATYASYFGDQGDVLDLPWLARVGTGLEFETGSTARYAPPRVRVMLRYVFGEDFGGVSVGAGLVY